MPVSRLKKVASMEVLLLLLLLLPLLVGCSNVKYSRDSTIFPSRVGVDQRAVVGAQPQPGWSVVADERRLANLVPRQLEVGELSFRVNGAFWKSK